MAIANDSGQARLSGARVLAWDGPTRVFKWLLVVLVFDGWLSNKFGSGFPPWHKWNGYAVLVLIVFRLFWGIVGGSTSRFSAFLAGPAASIAYIRAEIAGHPRKYLGHNPLGAWMIVALLAAVTAQALTGLFSADEDRLIIEGPLAKTVADAAVDFAARWHRRIFGAIEILTVLHIAANVFYTFVKRDPLIPAMVTGRKPADDFADMPQAIPGSWARAALCLLAATSLVFGAITLAGGRAFCRDRSPPPCARDVEHAAKSPSPLSGRLLQAPVRLVGKDFDLVVYKSAIALRNGTQIDVLPDMPGLGIDRDGAARADPA